MSELHFPSPPLRDDVVALRAWRADDVPERVMGFADPSVQRFLWAKTTPYTEADAHEFFAYQERARADGTELCFALTEPADDTAVLGGASLHTPDLAEGRAAVGYWLAPAARGRGVATHATRLLARWAFGSLAVVRLELTCEPANLASARVAERCGFTREALLRSHMPFRGGRRDTVMFGLLAGELR